MKRAASDHLLFLSQLRKRYTTTGSVAPSSRFLAAALTAPLNASKGPLRILEVGPGTGAVTRRIISLLKPEDRLDLVELNETFAEMLKRCFREDASYRKVAEQAEIHLCAIEEFHSDIQYDYIISGLPLNNFSAETVGEIFECFFRLLAPNGVLSYFEYMGMRKIRGMVVGRNGRKRIRALEEIMNSYLNVHRFRRNRVLVNFPPAWVQHLRKERDES
ncbi:MAG: methyltransferase domain-containing protein [Planctomycetes bacterium]|nr:methyltransferase domain-containing protein [Planctomycetota bacterium]